MSLQVWLPLNGNLNNNGLSSLSPIPSATLTYNDNGKIGKSFQSGSQYISLPLENVPTEISICFWVKPNSPYAWSDIFSLGASDNRLEVSTTTQYYWFCNSTALISHGTDLFTLDNAVWNHICMTADGTTVKFYLNGSLAKTLSQISSFSDIFGDNLKINIGSRIDGGMLYSGYINDFRIYDHCLSAKEVKEISKGLVCHYPLKSQYETGQVNKYSGDVAEGSLNIYGPFTKTKLVDERGYNYKISYTGTGSNTWHNMNAGSTFSFTAGKKYYYSCKVRCHSTNFVLALRASRSGNDWVTNMTNVLNPDGEWHEYVVYQTINSTYDRSGSTVTCNPILEFYTETLVTSGKVYSADFDIKDVQVIESNYYVPFIDNDMVSSVVSDCSGYGNNGTENGTINWSNNSPRYSGSYDFNGTGYIKNTSFNLNATEMTISFWVKIPETTTSQHFLFGTFDSWTGNGIGYWKDAGNNYYYSGILKSSAESSYVSLPTPSLTAGIWYHIVIVYTGTECILYVNGTENKRATYGKNGTIINPVCYLGNSLYNNTPSSETDESSMSDFRIYATALSEEDIKSLYNLSASIDKTGVLSAYEFVEEE